METLSLYADDMLLYLSDSGSSLKTALETIQTFGKHSGLKINWDKSQILPIDTGAPSQSQASSPPHNRWLHKIPRDHHHSNP